MPELEEGQEATVEGSRGVRYVLSRKGDVYACSCPSWTKQRARPEERSCKHLRTYLGEEHERTRLGDLLPGLKVPARPKHLPPRRNEDVERREQRRTEMTRAVERFSAAEAKMQALYGMRLPRHLAYAIGYWMGLSDEERQEAWAYVGNGPVAVGAWFLDGGLERRVTAGLDERLEYRYRCDPPELVSIFSGNSDGGHWGLWYEDPAELPRVVVLNHARDSAETSACDPTLLLTLYSQVVGSEHESWDSTDWPCRLRIIDWLEEVLPLELAAHRDQAVAPPRPQAHDLIGGMTAFVAGWEMPASLRGQRAHEQRMKAYRAKDPAVKQWIAEAFTELEAGAPGRALFLGRELHWLDKDEWRAECTDLLVRAYEALGRHALADIVRLHHAHRDLTSVGVYEAAEVGPFLTALGQGDVSRALEISESVPSAEIASALRTTDRAQLEALLANNAVRALAEVAANYHLVASERATKHAELAASARDHRAAALLLLEHGGAGGDAFERAIVSADPEIRETALRSADLGWRSPRGRSLLHLAARACAVVAIEQLLQRGADPEIKDADGKTALDVARGLWDERPAAVRRMLLLLKERTAPPPAEAPPPPAEWEVGMTVMHSKFGEGTVEAVAGSDEEPKLTIRFAETTKILMAKFVKRGDDQRA